MIVRDAPKPTIGTHQAVNKKLGRIVVYRDDDLRDLWNADGLVAEGVGLLEAHRFLHGQELITDEAAPSFDKMLEAIAAKLKQDCEAIMLTYASDEHWLSDMYQRTKSDRPAIAPPWR